MSLLPRSLIFCAISLCSLAKGNEPFPIIDKVAQQARDLDRRHILEAEFAAEQQALGVARQAMAKAPADDTRAAVHRHEENVKALQRELEPLQGEKPVRVSARAVGPEPVAVSKRTTPAPVQAPFWDVYRRGAPPTDFNPPAKELP
jgi:hypothetical protein